MQLAVTGRHLVVTEAIRRQIERKLARVDRLLNDNALSAQCVLAHERRQIVCELTVHARGDHALVAVGRNLKMAAAIAAAVDKVSQQAQKLAGRWKSQRRSGKPNAAETPAAAPATSASGPRVIRSRNHVLRSLTADDAALELGRTGQPVLVFRRVPTEAIAVVFRRPDGHVGLIDTGA